MGRPSKALSTLSRARNPLESPQVLILTERFRELQRDAFRTLVDKTIELGQILLEGRPLLEGYYTQWLGVLRIEEKTARNYTALARLADENPRLIHKWKELGPSKLYQIARLPETRRDAALKSATTMTAPEFIRSTSAQRTRTRKVTGNMTAHGLHNKVKALADFLEELDLPKMTSPAVRDRLATQLERACRLICALARRVKSE